MDGGSATGCQERLQVTRLGLVRSAAPRDTWRSIDQNRHPTVKTPRKKSSERQEAKTLMKEVFDSSYRSEQ